MNKIIQTKPTQQEQINLEIYLQLLKAKIIQSQIKNTIKNAKF